MTAKHHNNIRKGRWATVINSVLSFVTTFIFVAAAAYYVPIMINVAYEYLKKKPVH